MNSKEKDILDRIQRLEEAIAKAREYIDSGKNAHWHGFRPLRSGKMKDGKTQLPHRDWVRSVFLPQRQKALNQALEALAKQSTDVSRQQDSLRPKKRHLVE